MGIDYLIFVLYRGVLPSFGCSSIAIYILCSFFVFIAGFIDFYCKGIYKPGQIK